MLIFLIFLLPLLLVLGFFHVLGVGFANLGISANMTFLILLLMLVGSGVNIPLTKQKIIKTERSYFFGLFKKPGLEASGLAINLGGAVIPLLLSFYFLSKIPLEQVLIPILLMIIVSYLLARTIPGRGIGISAFIPPVFSAFIAVVLVPEFAAPCAFVSGVFGTLIGADILKIRKVQPGLISIGGAGVFDGVFLIGIISALLTG